MKRSDAITLGIAGVAIATAVVLAPEDQALERKRYSDRLDCECDYSPLQCELDGWTYVGPWYAVDEDVRRRDPADPGPGHCSTATRGIVSAGTGGGSGGGAGSGRRGSVSAESGYRSGFGGTAMRGFSGRG